MMTQQTMFDVPSKFLPYPSDWARWSGHTAQLFECLRSGEWRDRDWLEEFTNTKNFTARISNLRQRGYVIQCERSNEAGATRYRMTGYVGVSTTRGGHCPTCTCGGS